MKKLIRKFIVIALLLSALQGNANVNPTLRSFNNGKTTVLTLSGVQEGGNLYIKDLSGHVMYEDSITSSGEYVGTFNLTVLKKGAYYFEFNNDEESKRIPFKVANHKIKFEDDKETVATQKNKRVKKQRLSKKKQSSLQQPVEIEKGIQRRIPSFKGQDFVNYYRENQ